MIRIIDRYIFWSLWPPFFGGFFGTLVIVTFGNLLRAVKLLADGKVAKGIILQWFVYRLPEDMQYVFPVSVMLATLLVFGQMSRQSEITALRAAGVNPARLSAAVAVFGVILSVVLYVFLDRVVPMGMSRSQRIWEDKIRTSQPKLAFKDNVLMKDRSNRLISVGRFNLQSHDMQKLLIRDYDEKNRFYRQFTAGFARYLGGNNWELKDAAIYVRQDSGPLMIRKDAYVMPLGEGPQDFAREERSPVELTSRELLKEIRRLEERGLADTLNLKVELYLKSSFPVCVLIFCMIGCTMGFTSNRTGGMMGFGVSLLVTFLYYIFMSLSCSLGKTGVLHPLVATWIHNFVFMGLAVYLLARLQTR